MSDRIGSLLLFVRGFDHAVNALISSRADAIEHLFAVLERLDDAVLANLLETLEKVPEDDLVRSVEALSAMSPSVVKRVMSLLVSPRISPLVR